MDVLGDIAVLALLVCGVGMLLDAADGIALTVTVRVCLLVVGTVGALAVTVDVVGVVGTGRGS